MARLVFIASLVSLAPLATALRITKEQGNSSLGEISYTIVGTGVYCYDPVSVTEIYRDLASSPEQCRTWCDNNPDCGAYATYTGGQGPHCGSTGGACYGFSGCSGTYSSGCVSQGSTIISYLKDPPTPAAASATGDPHLENIHGELFDLTKPGKVVLVQIPRGSSADDSLLAVEADARQLGGSCADMYFQMLNITGAWADKVRAGGITFTTREAREETFPISTWTNFGPLELKVAHGHTHGGIEYLNFYIKHLRLAGAVVGGLLGEDDHVDAATPGEGCKKTLALSKSSPSDAIASEAIALM